MSSGAGELKVEALSLYFLPVEMRVPLKFGDQVLDSVTCARVRVELSVGGGAPAEGWGETPLSVAWVWPSDAPYEMRHAALKDFTVVLAKALAGRVGGSHSLEFGHSFIESELGGLRERFNAGRPGEEPLPYLAALVAFSAFDLAVHDAFAQALGVSVYESYRPEYLPGALDRFLEPDAPGVDFAQVHLSDLLASSAPRSLPVWHLVGGLDPISEDELDGSEPDDGYPVLLRDWIRRDGLDCLKLKLRGNDADWDRERLKRVGLIAREEGVSWLSTDFNCTVTDPEYVNEILDEVRADDPGTFERILYVEQPFPHDLEANRIDVHSVSERKPLFMDESAHDWRYVRLGRQLGWTGVALKTCKTQTGALLSLAFAKAHGMTLMVQDLTNPMLAQIPHCLLAAHAGTIMGVESNGMQFYPAASLPEEAVHPGLFRRREGVLDLSTLGSTGFGYRVGEIGRELPEAVIDW